MYTAFLINIIMWKSYVLCTLNLEYCSPVWWLAAGTPSVLRAPGAFGGKDRAALTKVSFRCHVVTSLDYVWRTRFIRTRIIVCSGWAALFFCQSSTYPRATVVADPLLAISRRSQFLPACPSSYVEWTFPTLYLTMERWSGLREKLTIGCSLLYYSVCSCFPWHCYIGACGVANAICNNFVFPTWACATGFNNNNNNNMEEEKFV